MKSRIRCAGERESAKMAKMSRNKGARVEREIVQMHRDLGVHAEKVPGSGALRYQGNAGDVDLYLFGADDEPVKCEVKARASGTGFKTLEGWMGEHELMFLKRNNRKPMVVVDWTLWERMISGAMRP